MSLPSPHKRSRCAPRPDCRSPMRRMDHGRAGGTLWLLPDSAWSCSNSQGCAVLTRMLFYRPVPSSLQLGVLPRPPDKCFVSLMDIIRMARHLLFASRFSPDRFFVEPVLEPIPNRNAFCLTQAFVDGTDTVNDDQ